MDIAGRMRGIAGLTPTEQALVHTILALGPGLQERSIKELAADAHCSVASIHRLCRKLGLEGYKQLKVELARSQERAGIAQDVDINFPFERGWSASQVSASMRALYAQTLAETQAALDESALAAAAEAASAARIVAVVTESHNRYPANMFVDRMLSIGRLALCEDGIERQVRQALAMDGECCAICISYSGVSYALKRCLPILRERAVPTFLIGTPAAARLNPGLAGYLCVSDAERYQGRITQFASHLAVHYALDTLFGCICAVTWDDSMRFLQEALPLTRKDGLEEQVAGPVPDGWSEAVSGL